MAKYSTYLGDTKILIEAPVAGALAKSDSDETPDPERAVENVYKLIGALADHTAKTLGPILRSSGAAFEMSFAVRADDAGVVMLSEGAAVGQFQCTLKFPAMRPAPQPQIPQRSQG